MRNIPKTKGDIHINSTIIGYRGFELIQYNQVIFKPLDNDDLVYFLQNIEKYKKKIKITPVGLLSINAIKKLPISRAIIVFEKAFNKIKLENNILEVGCGTKNSELSNFARRNAILDFEFLYSKRGTVGGAIRTNLEICASEISDILIGIETVDFQGNKKYYTKEECGFSFRKNNIDDDLIFIKAFFKANITKNTKPIRTIQRDIIKLVKRPQFDRGGIKELFLKNLKTNGIITSIDHNKAIKNLSIEFKREIIDKMKKDVQKHLKSIGFLKSKTVQQ